MKTIALAAGLPTLLTLAAVPAAAIIPAPVGVSTYWINGDDGQLFDIYDDNDGSPALVEGAGSHSAIGIAAWSDGITVYYDHWEDGYDWDPANPVATADAVFNLDEAVGAITREVVIRALIGR